MNRRKSLQLGASVLAAISAVPIFTSCKSSIQSEVSNAFWETILNRRSVRNYKSDPVPDEHIMKIIDAARMAPTSGNQQPWKFIVIKKKETIERLKKATLDAATERINKNKEFSGERKSKILTNIKNSLPGYFSAPVYIVVLTNNNSKYPTYNHHDGPLAAGYLCLAAKALGYGTVYMTDSIPEKVTKEVLNIPDHYTRVCVTPVGVPVEWPSKKKKDINEFIVHENFKKQSI